MLPMSVRDNLSFAAIDRFSRFGLIDRARRGRPAIDAMIELLQIRADGDRRTGRARCRAATSRRW